MRLTDNKRPFIQLLGILLLYILFVFVMQWSLLLGENLMKWDIYDAEYGYQVMMSDALHNLELPIWNPLVQYGVPYYAVFGMPIWYPITIIMGLIGFSTISLGFEYALHLVIAAFGMYLLCTYLFSLRGKNDGISMAVSFICGAIFASSGLFLSNASHIMFIISASWIPYVFYLVFRCAYERKWKFLLLAGLFSGFMVLGGYPEIVYNMFIVLVPVFAYVFYNKEKTIWKNIVYAAGMYIMLGIFAVLAAMITILPVIVNIPLITRAAGAKVPDFSPYIVLLSAFLPGMRNVYPSVEPTMINYFMGTITLISLPLLKHRKSREGLYLIGGAVACLFISFASNSFLFSLIYRFAPLYNIFHFSTVWRCLALIFLLLALIEPIDSILRSRDTKDVQRSSGLLTVVALIIGFGFGIGVYLFPADNTELVSKLKVLSTGGFVTGFCCLMYYTFFVWINQNEVKTVFLQRAFVTVVCVELLAYSFVEIPDTVTLFRQGAFDYDAGANDYITSEIDYCESRNRSVDFSDALRTRSRRDNRGIVFQKTLDEEGYLSFLLANTEEYKATYNRNLNSLLPEAIFTADIIDGTQVDYDVWKNDPSVTPWQIYVEHARPELMRTPESPFSMEGVELQPLDVSIIGETVQICYPIPASKTQLYGLRIYLESAETEIQANLTFARAETFYPANVAPISYQGTFTIGTDANGSYFDVILPHENDTYIYTLESVTIIGGLPISAMVGMVAREAQRPNVTITQFSFNQIHAQVHAQNNGYFVLMQAYHNGWKLLVDGVETPIEKVNRCFMGVYLSAGEHTVEFRFEPIDFYIGAIISIGYLLIVLAVFIVPLIIRKSRKVQRPNLGG